MQRQDLNIPKAEIKMTVLRIYDILSAGSGMMCVMSGWGWYVCHVMCYVICVLYQGAWGRLRASAGRTAAGRRSFSLTFPPFFNYKYCWSQGIFRLIHCFLFFFLQIQITKKIAMGRQLVADNFLTLRLQQIITILTIFTILIIMNIAFITNWSQVPPISHSHLSHKSGSSLSFLSLISFSYLWYHYLISYLMAGATELPRAWWGSSGGSTKYFQFIFLSFQIKPNFCCSLSVPFTLSFCPNHLFLLLRFLSVFKSDKIFVSLRLGTRPTCS